jgi:hypothetical protein
MLKARGVRLQALVANPELARLHVEYEVRRGKRFVDLIIAGRAWQPEAFQFELP